MTNQTTQTQRTARELAPALGSRVQVAFEELVLDCTVVDAKNSWGKVRLLVKPVAGTGTQWVELGRLVLAVNDANETAARYLGAR